MKGSSLPFDGTKQQETILRNKLAELKTKDGALMPALQFAQELYGYLPYEVQMIVAEELNVTLSEVYGVATFYSQFSLMPKGKYQIGICLGTACYVNGSQEIYDKLQNILGIQSGECTMDRLFSLDATRCVGCCGMAPVMTVNDDVYGKVKPEEVDAIIAKYRERG
ncbi:MAG: NADH-quinone oxidoreductase subunit NuoE [Corallococcus sp.]|nr:NADH-quinone oxidoreductase subunit NuoE [Corallococcus sp.]MCM1359608.1 NADH-quinone oxidoreductase subunit NuoE [Corallococcus sp.]MCM1395200.1 NADH-quinone oxidoreductase subunit NuoE [Corallococcus sp.]